MFAIYKRELKSYFTSMIGYLFLAFNLLIIGYYYILYCVTNYYTDFSYYVLTSSSLALILLIPMITMGIFSVERKQKTDQILFTSPVSVTEIVLGKYLAVITLFGVSVLVTVLYPVLISFFGKVPITNTISGFVGYILFGMALVAIGMFISTLTESIIISGVVTIVVFLAIYLSGYFLRLTSAEGLANVINWLSIEERFSQLTSGLMTLGNIVYLISIIAVFIFLSIQVIQRRRYKGELKLKKGTYSIGIILLVLAGTVGINLLVDKLNVTFDLSADKVYSISEQTEGIVKNIDEEVTIYVLESSSDFEVGYKEILTKYSKLNSKVNIEYRSPDKYPDFALQYVSGDINIGSMIVVCGDRHYFIDSYDYMSYTQTNSYSYTYVIEFEPLLTEALIYVTDSDTPTIYNILGHGELTFEENVTSAITKDNFAMEDVTLFNIDSIESDVAVVVINSPTSDLSKDDIKKLEDYIDNGGNIYITLDAVTEYLDNLYGFIKDYGIKVIDGVVVEEDASMYIMETQYYLLPNVNSHTITAPIINSSSYVLTVVSKGLTPYDKSGYKTYSLLSTSSTCYSKIAVSEEITERLDSDVDGPFSIAMLSESTEGGKLIVLGSSAALENDVDQQVGGSNTDFFVNGIEYMYEQEEKISIRGTNIIDDTGLYTGNDRNILMILAIIVVPSVCVITGIVIKSRRGKYKAK